MSTLIANANFVRSTFDSLDARNIKAMVISSGITKTIIITIDGATTFGTKRQLFRCGSPSAKNANATSTVIRAYKAIRSGPRDKRAFKVVAVYE